MCGRFALFTPPARMARYFGATLAEGTDPEHTPSWNVAPTDEVLGVRDRPVRPAGEPEAKRPDEKRTDTATSERLLMTFRWGLVPWWSKDAKSGSRLFNARSETVATKASFREAFRERRIIVPADGFYEWHTTTTGRKQPHYFTRADGAPLAFAGLAERWRPKGAPKDTPYLRSCTVITAPGGRGHGGHPRPHAGDPRPRHLRPVARPGQRGHRGAARAAAPAAGRHGGPPPRRAAQVGNVRNNEPALIEPA